MRESCRVSLSDGLFNLSFHQYEKQIYLLILSNAFKQPINWICISPNRLLYSLNVSDFIRWMAMTIIVFFTIFKAILNIQVIGASKHCFNECHYEINPSNGGIL